MSITISSAFDAGNIRVVGQSGDTIDLEIVKDHMSDFHQWFHFRLAGAIKRCAQIGNCYGFDQRRAAALAHRIRLD